MVREAVTACKDATTYYEQQGDKLVTLFLVSGKEKRSIRLQHGKFVRKKNVRSLKSTRKA